MDLRTSPTRFGNSNNSSKITFFKCCRDGEWNNQLVFIIYLENIDISHDGESFCNESKNYVNSEKKFPEEFLLGAAINQNKLVYL